MKILNDQNLMKDIIPYCDENFLTIPKWGEGDYTWQLNLWYIIRQQDRPAIEIENEIEDDLNNIINNIQMLYPDFEITFDKYYHMLSGDYYHMTNGRNIHVDFAITQANIDVLDENFIYDYDISKYMMVGVELLCELNKKFKENASRV